jgi:lysine 2,3-aminomutase
MAALCEFLLIMGYLQQNSSYRLPAKIQRIVQRIRQKNDSLSQSASCCSSYEEWCETLLRHFDAIEEDLSNVGTPASEWQLSGVRRMRNYLTNRTKPIPDPFLKGEPYSNEPLLPLWTALTRGISGGGEHYFRDMEELLDQSSGLSPAPEITRADLKRWMDAHPTGLDQEIITIRERNRHRILGHIKTLIESGRHARPPYIFPEGSSDEEKETLLGQWWNERKFHLRFAVRDPEMLNTFLDHSLNESTMRVLRRARQEGIPFFINPYYLSLLNTSETTEWIGSDLAIREYVIYNRDIIEEYGKIEAWEKEDKVIPGKPNAAGWILPFSNNLHRRYPEVAIMIPDTLGRTCGGLCVSCQRMYEFQSGNLNFNLDRQIEYEEWGRKLEVIMQYFENDKQLRDILITGGDALMSRDRALDQMFRAILEMASRKRTANRKRVDGEKYAEIRRIRLGTRLPAYLPQRVTPELIAILSEFRNKALKLGIKQFVIQTHFESAMEVTPEAVQAIKMLANAGWLVTNQHVFTVASSRRGHMAKLRATLVSIGVMPYYTFSVKGFMENRHNFATHARMMQEKHEEKVFGRMTKAFSRSIVEKATRGTLKPDEISRLIKQQGIPFISSDRSMMNLPGIGKSMTFKTIGITPDGRRILEFEYDHSRRHSPIVKKDDKVIIVESKPVGAYLNQVENMGEDVAQYRSLYGYSEGTSESLFPLFDYPDYPFRVTQTFNHI